MSYAASVLRLLAVSVFIVAMLSMLALAVYLTITMSSSITDRTQCLEILDRCSDVATIAELNAERCIADLEKYRTALLPITVVGGAP